MKGAILFTVLAGLVSTGLAIQCYVCTSDEDVACQDPFESFAMTKQTCYGTNSCMKAAVLDKVSRFCGYGNGNSTVFVASSHGGCTTSKVLGIEATTCTCYSDGCNSANLPKLSAFAAMTLVAAFKTLF